MNKFRNDLDAQAFGKCDDSFDGFVCVAIRIDVLNQRAVDLDKIHLKL